MVRQASTSFYWAMRLLPGEKRRAIFAVYAFCRNVDDIADDEGWTLGEKRRALKDWEDALDRLYEGGLPEGLVARALKEPIARFGLARADFQAVIDGMEMDAGEPIVAPPRAELDLYCDRVAAAVGRLCVCIFGEPGEAGRRVADALGRALQLTNILRDVHEDAERDRLYLPRELIEAEGLPSGDLPAILASPRYPAVWRALAGEAERAFSDAGTALAACDRARMRPARIMMEVYRRNLARMQALSDTDIADPAVPKRLVGKAEKLAIALRYGIL
ncbi:presqualene diphosphate synthase HpnD [Kaustia mangrovi]|uniref:Presqualene diphosphate synthase HpnD n=2 Tax=Kaustia mangrovi TaxID=2593653 RepID=A0A7S8C8L2_9HYPH|nr:presqualene diphosphate synthase HpnD [Kaustia mangrovi]QPC45400.1 presqualene diphosphate synthase HpnD [Kaustia mangrovi]